MKQSKHNSIEHMTEKLKFIDLFCGIGGFHQALTKLNYECVFAWDINAECRKTYEENYKIKPEGDIMKIDPKIIPDFDILCARFLILDQPLIPETQNCV